LLCGMLQSGAEAGENVVRSATPHRANRFTTPLRGPRFGGAVFPTHPGVNPTLTMRAPATGRSRSSWSVEVEEADSGGNRADERGMIAVIMAGGVIASIPVLIIFVIAQRYVIEGIARSGIKG
jgi:hypothetical protein